MKAVSKSSLVGRSTSKNSTTFLIAKAKPAPTNSYFTRGRRSFGVDCKLLY